MEKLKVFTHLIYECKKGVRSAALCTLQSECEERAVSKLETNQMAYFICPLSNSRMNVFFGERVCIEVIRRFCNKPLNKLSPEEDFILGAILGYSICEQCGRYCKKSAFATAAVPEGV